MDLLTLHVVLLFTQIKPCLFRCMFKVLNSLIMNPFHFFFFSFFTLLCLFWCKSLQRLCVANYLIGVVSIYMSHVVLWLCCRTLHYTYVHYDSKLLWCLLIVSMICSISTNKFSVVRPWLMFQENVNLESVTVYCTVDQC